MKEKIFFLLFPKMELVYSHRVYCDLFIIKMQIFIIFVQNKNVYNKAEFLEKVKRQNLCFINCEIGPNVV